MPRRPFTDVARVKTMGALGCSSLNYPSLAPLYLNSEPNAEEAKERAYHGQLFAEFAALAVEEAAHQTRINGAAGELREGVSWPSWRLPLGWAVARPGT